MGHQSGLALISHKLTTAGPDPGKEFFLKERNGDLWEMTLRMEIPKTRIPTAAWKSLAKNARLSHIYTPARR